MFEGKNFALIKANRLFAGTAQKIKISISGKELLSVGAGDIIYKENDDSDSIFLIISGEVKVEIPGILKKAIVVTKSAKDFFGEKDYYKKAKRGGNAVAATDCQLCILSREKINKLVTQDKQIFVNLFGIQPDQSEEIEGFTFDPITEEIDSEEFSLEEIDIENDELIKGIMETMPDTDELSEEEIENDTSAGLDENDISGSTEVSDAEEKNYEDELSEKEKKVSFDFLKALEGLEKPPNAESLSDSIDEIISENNDKTSSNDIVLPDEADIDLLPDKPRSFSFNDDEGNSLPAEKSIPETVEEEITENTNGISDELNIDIGEEEDSISAIDTEKKVSENFDEDDDFIELTDDDLTEIINAEELNDDIEEPVVPEETTLTDNDIEELINTEEPVVIDDKIDELIDQEETVQTEDDLLDLLLNEPLFEKKKSKKKAKPAVAIPKTKGEDSNQYNELSEEVDEMTAAQFKKLLDAAHKINSGIKLDETLESILDASKMLTGAEHGYLYLVDNETKELWAKALNKEVGKEIRLKIGEDIPGVSAEKNEIINIKNAPDDSRFNKDRDKTSGKNTKSLLCFPVTNKSGYVTAVLELTNSNKGEFNLSDEEALSALSLNISLALENAELIERQLQNDRLSSMGKMANFLIQDIKKPVLTIKYYAEHIKKKEVSADVVQVLNMLIDQSNAVVDLVQTTLSYSEGKGILRAQPLRLSEVLNHIFGLLAEYVESRHVTLYKKYESDAVVNIDKREFYQACFQIVKNACDAMPSGGDIYVVVKMEAGHIQIDFKDSGVGIADSIKSRIFEPFMTHGKKQGVGLGLSIAEKIVKDHGGTISFQSEAGEGTTFSITLPYISVV